MDHQKSDFTSSEVTHQSFRKQIILTTDPTYEQVELLCAFLAGRIDLNTTGNSKTSESRQVHPVTGLTTRLSDVKKCKF